MKLSELDYSDTPYACPSNFTDRDDEHKLFVCRLPKGHAGRHESPGGGAWWTDEHVAASVRAKGDNGMGDHVHSWTPWTEYVNAAGNRVANQEQRSCACGAIEYRGEASVYPRSPAEGGSA